MKVRIGCASWLTLLLVGSSIIVVSPESSTTVTTTFQQPTVPSSTSMSYDKFLKNKLTPFLNFVFPTTLRTITTTTTSTIYNNEYENKPALTMASQENRKVSQNLIINENSIKITTTKATTTSISSSTSSTSDSNISKSSVKNELSSSKDTNAYINIVNQHAKDSFPSTTTTSMNGYNHYLPTSFITSPIINEKNFNTIESLEQHNSQHNQNNNQQNNHLQHYDHRHLYHENYQNQLHYQHDDKSKRINSIRSGSRGSSTTTGSKNFNRNSNNFSNRNNNILSHSISKLNSNSNKSKRNVPQNDEPIDPASLQADLCAKFTIGDVDTKTFYSPNYPDNYPKNINCTKVITAPPDHIIRLDFRDVFNIEDKEECKFDYLEVRDGPYGFSKLAGAGRFCGRTFPEEIISTERHLWLYFHSDESIEYEGFTAVYEFVERPKNVPSKDLNCTIIKKGYEGWINNTDVPQYVRDNVTEHKIPIDCMWRIEAPENWRIQTKFMLFDLKMPNDCNMNFIDIFPEDTTIPARLKNFCGSAGESAQSSSSVLHIRYYAEHQAMNSQFEILYTAYRDKGSSNCNEEHEYDCEDTTCISRTLECNGRDNCKFRWDEENCKSDSGGQSEHVVIIIVVFGLILGGMIASFLFNCIRKLVRDQKIIREHIRQSKESKLDEMGRSSVKRSGENLSVKLSPKEKHSQTSLQILDDVSNRFYREMIPLPEIKADPILRQHHDIVAQTNLGPIIDDRESLSSPDRGIGNSTCDMGCQTRESLFSPPSTTTLVRQKSSLGSSSSSPNQSQSAIRFSTFGYDTNNPPISQKSKTLSRQSTINNRTSAAIEMEELQHHHHNTLPHNIHQHQHQHHIQQQQQYPVSYSKQSHRLSGMQTPGIDMPPIQSSSLSSGRTQPEVCHHHHQHKQHLQQQQQLQAAQQQQHQQQQHQQQQQQQLQIGFKLASGGNTTAPSGGNNKQQQGKLDESKVYIDIRKSAPDVIIMTSH